MSPYKDLNLPAALKRNALGLAVAGIICRTVVLFKCMRMHNMSYRCASRLDVNIDISKTMIKRYWVKGPPYFICNYYKTLEPII